MNAAAVFALIQKGLGIVGTLIEAAEDVTPALKALTELTQKGSDGKVTQADLDATEKLLDEMIAEFNADLPNG